MSHEEVMSLDANERSSMPASDGLPDLLTGRAGLPRLPGPPTSKREFLTTTPGTRMTIYTDGSVEFNEPDQDA